MAPVDFILKLLGIIPVLILLYVIAVGGYSIYLYVNRDDQSVLPPTDWWWPTWLNKYLHNYPRKYDVFANTYTYLNSGVSNVYSNSFTAKDCTKHCEGEGKDCIAAMSNTASNVCMTMTATDSYLIDYTGNTVYIVSGMEPSTSYGTYQSNVANSNTAATTIPLYVASSYLQCSSNCMSNSNCAGFEYQWSTNTCIQHSSIKSSELAYDASYTSYILRTGVGAYSTI